MALNHDDLAAREYFDKIAEFCEKAMPFTAGIINHTVKPDESTDMTLISRRVYGSSFEYLAIMAAAGVSHYDDILPSGRVILLPSPVLLNAFKQMTGYESNDELIESGKPIWAYS